MKPAAYALIVAMAATPAFAHTGINHLHGFLDGLVHPFLGADHLLAMLTVGLWSGFVMPKRVWAGAAAFLTAMVLGALASWAGLYVPGVEATIVASVVFLGLLTLVSRQGQVGLWSAGSLAAIAVFAFAHGHAHATEASGNKLIYLAGFLIATGALHLGGIVIAKSVADRPVVRRALGAGVTLSGLWLMAG